MSLPAFINRKFVIGATALLILVSVFAFFAYGLEPASADASMAPVVFTVKQGEGFRTIVNELSANHIIRSSLVAGTLSLLTGSAFSLQPGSYRLSPSMSPSEILDELSNGRGREVSVTIPEGANLYQIDAALSDALVIQRGALVNFHDDGDLEGRLFPDTYWFFTGSDARDVVQKFLDNFNAKAAPLLAVEGKDAGNDLIVASMVEKEVSDPQDKKIVAGILWKREKAGMPLQVDATVCYAAQVETPTGTPACGTLDLKLDSPYNTYLYKGFPPAPIGNPGLSAIEAAISPASSPYWFYLSDPKTGKTIFAKTLDEQHQNTVKYLK